MAAPNPKIVPVYTVAPAAGGFALLRNGTALETPAGAPLIVPTAPLVEAIAAEARTQGPKPDPATMPLTQLAMTAIDIVGKDRATIIDQIMAYGESELLCYRAEASEALAAEQQKIWQPVLDWCAQRFKASLRAGTGIMPITQSAESLQILRRAIERYDNFHLAGLSPAAGISGSLALALALAEKQMTAEAAFYAAELDTTHQMIKWGDDPAALKRREGIRRDLEICERWFALLAKKPA